MSDPTRALFHSTSDKQQRGGESNSPARPAHHTGGGPVAASNYSIATNATPPRMLELIQIAQQRWLAKTELHEILSNAAQYRLAVSHVQVLLPPSGSLVLYDKSILRRFRKDGHEWVTKRSSNTTREDRSRLKVNGTIIDCNYAHGVHPRSFHRRIYQLHGTSLVLLHYLDDEQDNVGDRDSSTTPRAPATPAGSAQASPLVRRQGTPASGPGTPSSSFVASLTASTVPSSSPHLTRSNPIDSTGSASQYQVNTANNCWFGVRSYCPSNAPRCGGSDLLICTDAPTVVNVMHTASNPDAGRGFPSVFPDVWKLQRSGEMSAMFTGAVIGKSCNAGYTLDEAFFLCVRFGHTAVRAHLLSPSCIRVKVRWTKLPCAFPAFYSCVASTASTNQSKNADGLPVVGSAIWPGNGPDNGSWDSIISGPSNTATVLGQQAKVLCGIWRPKAARLVAACRTRRHQRVSVMQPRPCI